MIGKEQHEKYMELGEQHIDLQKRYIELQDKCNKLNEKNIALQRQFGKENRIINDKI